MKLREVCQVLPNRLPNPDRVPKNILKVIPNNLKNIIVLKMCYVKKRDPVRVPFINKPIFIKYI